MKQTNNQFLTNRFKGPQKDKILNLAMKGKDEVRANTQPSPHPLNQKRQKQIWK